MLQTVERVVDVNAITKLACCHVWTPFRDMSMLFDLPYPQYVQFSYNINWGSSGPCCLAARLIVDGKEDRAFLSHTAHMEYP